MAKQPQSIQPGEKKIEGGLINIYKCLKGDGRQMNENRLLLVVHSDRTRSYGLNLNTGNSIQRCRRTSSRKGWQSTGTGCPERLWSLLLRRYLWPIWTPTCVTYCREPALARSWTQWFLGVPSNSCDSVTAIWQLPSQPWAQMNKRICVKLNAGSTPHCDVRELWGTEKY